MKIGNFGIGVKIVGGFLIVTALLLAVFGISFNSLNMINSSANSIYNQTDNNFNWAN